MLTENLLKSDLFRGVCLLSHHGEIVYTYGQLKDLPEVCITFHLFYLSVNWIHLKQFILRGEKQQFFFLLNNKVINHVY